MANKKKQTADSAVHKGNAAVIIIIVILIFLILVGAGIFIMWRMFFAFSDHPTPREFPNQYATPESTTEMTVKGNIDPALVGTWESACLVPDANSPWSEKHQFIINADGTAQHTRWSSGGHACAPETTLVDKYVVSTPASGKIDFRLIEGIGPDAQDIYQVSGDTLLFGHGFRNNLPYGAGTLNQYIVYQKKK